LVLGLSEFNFTISDTEDAHAILLNTCTCT